MSNIPATLETSARDTVAIPRVPLSRRLRTAGLWLVLALFLAWSWSPAEMSKATSLFTDWHNMAEFGSAFLQPNFHEWELYLQEMVVTIQIAAWGTALAVVLGTHARS